MKFIRKSLGVKVILLSSILTVVAFAGLFIYNSISTRDHTLHEVEAAAERVADMLYIAIEDPMSVGDNEGTEIKFEDMAERYPDTKVYMTDYKGEVTYATERDAERKNIFKVRQENGLPDLIRKSLKEKMVAGELMDIDGKLHFAEVKSIENSAECYHCHGKSRKILGTMVVAIDVSPQFNALKDNQFKSAAISVFGVIALLTALIIFMRRAIVNRITTIAATTEEVSKGNLDAKFTVKGSDELGSLSRYLGEMVDQIRDQLQYNQSVLDGIVVPLFVSDKDLRLQFINPPLRTILGLSEDEVKGRLVSDIFTCDSEDEASCNAADVIGLGEPVTGRFVYRRNDGVDFPLLFEASPLKDAEGKSVGVICVLIDLTREEEDKKNIELQRQDLLVVANEVTEVANKLNEASDALSDHMTELARGVDTTADQTSQVATAMEEMNATVLEVARNASETAEASNQANKVAADGGTVVGETVVEINTVADITENLAEALGSLSSRAENIGKVMAVINDIADQTNLLALNAAIEAARAGEAGRGFAVVADEVRKLAEKTMQATQEVEQAVHAIQAETRRNIEEMNNAANMVSKSTEYAGQAGESLGTIVQNVDSTADQVRAIATASEEQSAASEQINRGTDEVNRIAMETAEAMQQSMIAVSDLARLSADLQKLIEELKDV